MPDHRRLRGWLAALALALATAAPAAQEVRQYRGNAYDLDRQRLMEYRGMSNINDAKGKSHNAMKEGPSSVSSLIADAWGTGSALSTELIWGRTRLALLAEDLDRLAVAWGTGSVLWLKATWWPDGRNGCVP